MEIENQVGPQILADGVAGVPRLGRAGDTIGSDLHGRYYEQAYRGNVFFAASQAATAWSVALNATHTGLVVSNPAGSAFNLVMLTASFALSVAPAAIASIGLFAGFAAAGIVAHTTPLVPMTTLISTTQATGRGKADGAATLVGTPTWVTQMIGGFTAAALPSTTPSVIDLGGVFVIPPGGYFGIGALTAVTGFGSLIWEEVPV